MRAGIETSRTRNVSLIPSELCDAATAALLAYRTHCAASSAPGQLILPEALKLLPLYVSCITRLPAFAQNKPSAGGKGSSAVGLGGLGTVGQSPGAPFYDIAMRCDRRAAELCALNALPAHRILSALYTRVYRVDEACCAGEGEGGGETPAGGLVAEEEEEEEEGCVGWGSGGSGGGGGGGSPSLGLPPPTHVLRALTKIHLPAHGPSGATFYPSSDLLADDGAYLIETASKLYLWLGPGVAEAFCASVFGCAAGTPAALLPLGLPLPRVQPGRPNSVPLRRLWGFIRGVSARRVLGGTAAGELPVHVVVPSDGAGKEEVGYALLEDRMPGAGPAATSSTTPSNPTNARSYVEVLCAIHSAITASINANS